MPRDGGGAFTPCLKRALAAVCAAFAFTAAQAQDIETIAKSNPLVITGSLGTNNTYRSTSGGMGYGSPLGNSLFANLNFSVYGFSMPLSFYYTNNSTSFSYPQLSFNLTPSYRNWKLYIGRSSMGFNPYMMDMSFNGVGLEYDSQKFRVGGFYGTLRGAVNDGPGVDFPRRPQYKRVGWGFKVGVGGQSSYFNLFLMRAYDRESSLSEANRANLTPQENLLVGLSGGVGISSWLSFSSNIAATIYSQDTEAAVVEDPAVDKFKSVFKARYSTLLRFAGDANLNLTFPGFSTSLSYRMVQPDYASLASTYMPNNYHSLGVNMATFLFRTISLSAQFSGQQDNLTAKQMYTTKALTYSVNASTRLGSKMTISAGYNGYTQTQGDGTVKVVDSARVNRRMSSFTLTPSYATDGDNFGHTAALSLNASFNKDLNPIVAGKSDVNTLAAGLSYSLDVKAWETSFNASLNHQQSKGYGTKFDSQVLSVGAGRSFLKEKNLNVSAGISANRSSAAGLSSNITIGADASASYVLKKVHSFSCSLAYSKYSDVNITADGANLQYSDFTMGLNYVYTFSLLEIKGKAEREEANKAKGK